MGLKHNKLLIEWIKALR